MTNTLPEMRGFFIPSSEENRLPFILARWFAYADSDAQEKFIEHMYDEFSAWGKPPEFQWAFWNLSPEAKGMLMEMASHSTEKSE